MPERLLIVDPDSGSWAGVISACEAQGISVAQAPDGLVGLNAAVKMAPSVVVLATELERLQGFELCRRIRAHHQTADIPVVFASTRQDEAHIKESFQAGGWDYVCKPIRTAEFLARLRAHQRLSQTLQSLRAQLADKPVVDVHAAPHPTVAAREAPRAEAVVPVTAGSAPADALDLGDTLNLARVEMLLIHRALAQTKGNVARAARLLGINRSRIYRKFGASLKVPQSDISS